MFIYSALCISLAALTAIPTVSAHGYVSGVVSGGQWYPGASPNWFYGIAYGAEKPAQAGWYAYNQDTGFVAPSEYGDENITCHKGATPGNTSIPVTAGSSIDLQWTPWPSSHHGPVLNYLARCYKGDCTNVTASELNFFKLEASGLVNGSVEPGTWASDQLISNNNTYTLPIPPTLSGHFVLRHEIIALHAAGSADGAQNYPMCINLNITSTSSGGTETAHPCLSGADCRGGTMLYKETDPGILVNVYQSLENYTIPGPSVWNEVDERKKVEGQARELIV